MFKIFKTLDHLDLQDQWICQVFTEKRRMGHTTGEGFRPKGCIINWMVRRFGKWWTTTWKWLKIQCNAERETPMPSSTSRWGHLFTIVFRHDMDIKEFRVKPTRRACGQDATKDTLKSVTKTLRIWGYKNFLKVCSKMFPEDRPPLEIEFLEFKLRSIWTVCRFENRHKQRANSGRTVSIEYSPINMSR